MSQFPEKEQRHLDFVKRLTPAALGRIAGKDLLNFSGVTSQGDLQEMTKAIEEGCTGTR